MLDSIQFNPIAANSLALASGRRERLIFVMAPPNTFLPKYFSTAERCVDDRRRRSLLFFNHFKKFARRANFLKCCRGGVWGGEAPPGNSVRGVWGGEAPPGSRGGVWGGEAPLRNLRYPSSVRRPSSVRDRTIFPKNPLPQILVPTPAPVPCPFESQSF